MAGEGAMSRAEQMRAVAVYGLLATGGNGQRYLREGVMEGEQRIQHGRGIRRFAALRWERDVEEETVAVGSQADRAEPRARFLQKYKWQAEPGSARVFPSLTEPSHEPARLGSIPPLRAKESLRFSMPSCCPA